MKITAEQEKVLDSFVCERLSSNSLNAELMNSFESKKGESLVNYFKRNGLAEDVSGKTAYYVIKNEEQKIMMFFSLKCGALFDPLLDEDAVQQDFQRLIILLQAIKNANGVGTEADEANHILKKYQVDDRISARDFKAILAKVEGKSKYLNMLSKDREEEANEQIFQKMERWLTIMMFLSNLNRDWMLEQINPFMISAVILCARI